MRKIREANHLTTRSAATTGPSTRTSPHSARAKRLSLPSALSHKFAALYREACATGGTFRKSELPDFTLKGMAGAVDLEHADMGQRRSTRIPASAVMNRTEPKRPAKMSSLDILASPGYKNAGFRLTVR
jgi:hypothetical protein